MIRRNKRKMASAPELFGAVLLDPLAHPGCGGGADVEVGVAKDHQVADPAFLQPLEAEAALEFHQVERSRLAEAVGRVGLFGRAAVDGELGVSRDGQDQFTRFEQRVQREAQARVRRGRVRAMPPRPVAVWERKWRRLRNGCMALKNEEELAGIVERPAE